MIIKKLLILSLFLGLSLCQDKVLIELDGVMKGYSETGIMIEEKKHGQWYTFSKLGIHSIENYEKGILHGYQIYFSSREKGNLNPPSDSNHVGRLSNIYNYKNGKRVNSVFFYNEKLNSIDFFDSDGDYVKSLLFDDNGIDIED